LAGSDIATGLFTSAAAGMLAALLLAPFQELRRLFFAVNAGLALGLLALGTAWRPALSFAGVHGRAPDGAGDLAGAGALLAIGLTVAHIATLYLPARGQGRGFLVAASLAALATTALDGWRAARGAAGAWWFGASALAAAALLGSVIVAMILGHWYLVRWSLPAGHLVRYSLVMAWAVGLRAALLAAALLAFGAASPGGLRGHLAALAIERAVFFWPRIAFGIVGPAVFAYMVYETARIRSTQSATGILYIAVIFVLMGEFLARYLSVAGAGPM
jgi:hypothetical protein